MEGCHLVYTFFFVRSVAYLSLFLLAAGCQQSPEAISATNQISGGLQAPVSVRVASKLGTVDCLLEKPLSHSAPVSDSPTHPALSLPPGTVLAVPSGKARVATIEGTSWSTKRFIEVIAPRETQNDADSPGTLGDGTETCWVNAKHLDARMTAGTTTRLVPMNASGTFTPDSDPSCTLNPDDVISFQYIMGDGLTESSKPLVLRNGRSVIVKISGIEDANGNDTTANTCANLVGNDALIKLQDFREAAWYERSPFVLQ